MLLTADYFIKELNLLAHPEGGFYKETYRSTGIILREALPAYFNGDRSFSTGIYFLLRSGEFSHLHKIASDEMWHFYYGSALTVYVIDPKNTSLNEINLGRNLSNGEVFQAVVPQGCWFGAKVNSADGFALVGCTVSPGFDFNDFEMAKRDELLAAFPQFKDVINSLTKP